MKSAGRFLRKTKIESVRSVRAYMMPKTGQSFSANEESSAKKGGVRKALRAILRNRDGSWNVPYANWNGSKWNRNANWLTNDWDSNYRVVLLDTHLGSPPSVSRYCGTLGGSFLGAYLPSVQHAPYFLGLGRERQEFLFINASELMERIEHEFQRIVLPDGVAEIGRLRCRRRELRE
jgi:hypothetical protein